MNACTSSRRGESGLSSLTHPDPRKPRESANGPSPALAGTLSPSEGQRGRVGGPALGPRLFPIPTCGSGVVSLLKSRRRRKEALISAAFPKEFEPPYVGSYKEWSFSRGCQGCQAVWVVRLPKLGSLTTRHRGVSLKRTAPPEPAPRRKRNRKQDYEN